MEITEVVTREILTIRRLTKDGRYGEESLNCFDDLNDEQRERRAKGDRNGKGRTWLTWVGKKKGKRAKWVLFARKPSSTSFDVCGIRSIEV
jgi:hypothetical protein